MTSRAAAVAKVALAALLIAASVAAPACAQYAFRFALGVDPGAQVQVSDPLGLRQGTTNFECLGFTNVSRATIAHIRFKFTYIDAGGDVVGSDTMDINTPVGPGIYIQRPTVEPPHFGYRQDFSRYPNCMRFGFPHQGIALNVISVQRIDYADGTSWAQPPAATPTPNASP